MKRLPAIATVTTEELAFAYAVGCNAALGTIPQSSVRGYGIDIQSEDGSGIERIGLTDIPMNRMAIAIRDQFPSGQLMPLLSRIWAMQAMMKLPEAEAYTRQAPDGSGEEISDAFFQVAAIMPLNHKMEFNRSTFFKRVAAVFDGIIDK